MLKLDTIQKKKKSPVTTEWQQKGYESYNWVVLCLQANRWKKRGLSLVPTRFGVFWQSAHYNVFVAIYHSDGTIAIEHGGIEVGQGINQKVCALVLLLLYLSTTANFLSWNVGCMRGGGRGVDS